MAVEFGKHRAEFGDRPLVIPIPLHRNKFRARGFNQAEEIAASLKKITGYDMKPFVLQRRRDTSSQTGMSAHQRRENVRAAFVVRPQCKREVAGRNIILVDDVMTTGATAAECSRVLLRAGAKQVFVLTAARVTSQAVMNSLAAGAGAQG
jgi:ComF family protein